MNNLFGTFCILIGIYGSIYGFNKYDPVPHNTEVGQKVHHKNRQGGQHMSMPFETVHLGSGIYHADIKQWNSNPQHVSYERYRFSSTNRTD